MIDLVNVKWKWKVKSEKMGKWLCCCCKENNLLIVAHNHLLLMCFSILELGFFVFVQHCFFTMDLDQSALHVNENFFIIRFMCMWLCNCHSIRRGQMWLMDHHHYLTTTIINDNMQIITEEKWKKKQFP